MANTTTHRFTKQGPKRLRRTRRELPYGQVSLWGSTVTHFKREREAKRAPVRKRPMVRS